MAEMETRSEMGRAIVSLPWYHRMHNDDVPAVAAALIRQVVKQDIRTRRTKMKSITGIKMMGIMTIASLTLVVLVSCSPPPSAAPTTASVTAAVPATYTDTAVPPTPSTVVTDVTDVDGEGNTDIDLSTLGETLNSISTGTLSGAEVEGLLYMREEEKLARDVYLVLYEKWGMSVFQNIANSEQTHTDAIKTLLDRYGLGDPAAGQDVGIFTNPGLQELYDLLVDTGNRSLVDALRVGAAIEEIDILDLEEWIAQTSQADIVLVYENLMKGSRNHLRSFVSTLEKQTGETYQPQYLDQAGYDAIVSSPIERGGRGGQ
jgi:hypothetical protein